MISFCLRFCAVNSRCCVSCALVPLWIVLCHSDYQCRYSKNIIVVMEMGFWEIFFQWPKYCCICDSISDVGKFEESWFFFLSDVLSQCSRTYLGRLSSGVITSYNYPFDYGDNLTCTYRIYMDLNPNLMRTICFTFFRFDLETSSPFCSFDYLSFGFPLPVKYCCGGIWQYGQEDGRNVLSSVWSRNLCCKYTPLSEFFNRKTLANFE